MIHEPAHVLVVDDEALIRTMMSELLKRRGYNVAAAEDGKTALSLIQQQPYDLILLDLKLPDMGGIDVVQQAREYQPDSAVIILTGHGSLNSAINALHLGVFDYILKTTAPHEVLDRVAAALAHQAKRERTHQLLATLQTMVSELRGEYSESQAVAHVEPCIIVGDLQLSPWTQTVRRGSEPIQLTPTEFRVLMCLAQQPGQVITYQAIARMAQGRDTRPPDAAELIKPHLYHLRLKLEHDPSNPQYILTVRGTGYLLNVMSEPAA